MIHSGEGVLFESEREGHGRLRGSVAEAVFGEAWLSALNECMSAFAPARRGPDVHRARLRAERAFLVARRLLGEEVEEQWRAAFFLYLDAMESVPACWDRLSLVLSTELMLYCEDRKKPYREHYAHPIYVYLAGRALLDRMLSDPGRKAWLLRLVFSSRVISDEFLRALPARLASIHPGLAIAVSAEDVASATDEDRCIRILRIAWLLSALLHDVAYPSFQLAERGQTLADVTAPVCLHPHIEMTVGFRAFAEQSILLHALGQRLRPTRSPEKALLAITESLPRNHSVASGLQTLHMLYSLLPDWRREPEGVPMAGLSLCRPSDAKKVFDAVVAFELAAKAIALHDLDFGSKAGDIDGRLDLEDDPLGMLLHLVDSLQEWDRPILRRTLAAARSVGTISPFRGVLVRVADRDADGVEETAAAPLTAVRVLATNVARMIARGQTWVLCQRALCFRSECALSARRVSWTGRDLKILECIHARKPDGPSDCYERYWNPSVLFVQKQRRTGKPYGDAFVRLAGIGGSSTTGPGIVKRRMPR